eukprot:998818-Lingulodinium_polyedra.AAC.1
MLWPTGEAGCISGSGLAGTPSLASNRIPTATRGWSRRARSRLERAGGSPLSAGGQRRSSASSKRSGGHSGSGRSGRRRRR